MSKIIKPAGIIIEVLEKNQAYSEDGVVYFGPVIINTDEEEDEDDEYYDEEL